MPQSPFYSTKQWKEARGKYLRLHRHCEICARIGVQTPAVEVDHVRSIEFGGSPLDPRNFSAKCRTHHSQKTMSLDMPGRGGRDRLVTTGPDGFPCYIEESFRDKRPKR